MVGIKKGRFSKEWERLLSKKRFRQDEKDGTIVLGASNPQPGRSPFEMDIGRVVFSQPFRRLAGKTQVHPFSVVDYVHNRLTHSNEVAYISRALGRLAAQFIREETGDISRPEQVEEVGWICQAAGMMHDIGNPPYGHAGESAIRAWAKKNEEELQKVCEQCVINDFLHFDGNAQAFRMASRPGMRESCYFRLTAAVLGAMVKYPWATNSNKGMTKDKSTAFSTEENILKDLFLELGIRPEQRHPLSYLTEAADDICYRICDFEDAVLMGLMEEDHVKSILLSGMTKADRKTREKYSFSKIKALTIGDLINAFMAVFKKQYKVIMRGEFEGDLRSKITGAWGVALDQIKKEYDIIFSERKKIVSEIGAYGQISSILDKYLEFLKHVKKGRNYGKLPSYDELPFLCKRLVALAWGGSDYYVQNRSQSMEWWAHSVLDFIVGMTDDYLHHISAEFM